MLSVQDWIQIRRLHRAEGLPIRSIVRVLGYRRIRSRRRGRAQVAGSAASNANATRSYPEPACHPRTIASICASVSANVPSVSIT